MFSHKNLLAAWYYFANRENLDKVYSKNGKLIAVKSEGVDLSTKLKGTFKVQNFTIFSILFDIPESYQMGFQESATIFMEGLINFHHDIVGYVTFIAIFVLWFLIRILVHFKDDNTRKHTVKHNTFLEIVWTVVPAAVLVSITTPSLALLYTSEEQIASGVALKVIGHQWYWFYEYINRKRESIIQNLYPCFGDAINNSSFSSNLVTDSTILKNFRLADTDLAVHLPVDLGILVSITSSDVLHSWTVPSLGVKMDACPGRINVLTLVLERKGNFVGQCSEICGSNHAAMPIWIKSVTIEQFNNFLISNMQVFKCNHLDI